MAKAKKTPVAPVTAETSEVIVQKTFLEDLSREELKVRYQDNVAHRQALADENKLLVQLYKGAVSTEKKSSAEAKIAALQAKLDALKNPSPVVSEIPAVETETAADSLAM